MDIEVDRPIVIDMQIARQQQGRQNPPNPPWFRSGKLEECAAPRLLVRGGQHPADADKGGAGDAVEPARETAAPEPGREPRR